MNMLLDRDDPRRENDENLDTISNMSEFNAAPSGSKAVSGGENRFYLRDEEVLQWAKNAGDSDDDEAASKRKSDKRLQLEKSRRAKLDLDDDDMMFRLGYGGLMDDDDLSGDEEARERKRQRAFGMEEEDDEQNILAPIPDEGSGMRITKGSLRCRWTLLKKKKRSLNPRFNRKRNKTSAKSVYFLIYARRTRLYVRDKNVRKSRDSRTNVRLSLISKRALRTTSTNNG